MLNLKVKIKKGLESSFCHTNYKVWQRSTQLNLLVFKSYQPFEEFAELYVFP